MEINYQLLLRNLYASVLVIDRDFNIIYFNHGSSDGLKVDNPTLHDAVAKAFLEKSSFVNVEVKAAPDNANQSIWLPKVGYASGHYTNVDGQDLVSVSIVDITNFFSQTRNLEDQLRNAKNTEELRSSYLQNMAHDMRSPLNAIVGFSKLITETEDKAKIKRYSEIIDTNSRLLLTLADDVLDIARADSGTLTFDYSTINVNSFIKSMADMTEIKVKPGVMVNCVFGGSDFKLYTAPDRLSQVMLNLLNNAVKYTEHGSITVGYEMRPNEIYFFVKDTGIGISRDKQKHVFKRFWREHRDNFGTGLGLPICKDIIEHMGGEIGLKSDGEGAGSTFWFTLPYSKDMQSSAESIGDDENQSHAEEEADLPTLLIAEDNEGNFMLYEALFDDAFNIIHAWNGLEAVELASSCNPDLILMDISMPGMDGYEATEQIRKNGVKAPVIAVTAYAFSSDKAKVMQKGFDAYISKPIKAEELLQAMEKCLNDN